MSDATEGDGPKKPKQRPPKPLTVMQIRFCEIYAEKGNATESYLDAGFTAGTRDSAHVMAWRLLRNEAIRNLIRTLREEAAVAARASISRIAAAMAHVAFSDRRELFDSEGRLRPPHE